MPHFDKLGIKRQDHYGAGRQPWDDILDLGLAPDFAAANVLKYLRRIKEPEHSLDSARWYWDRLHEMAEGGIMPANCTRRQTLTHMGRANNAFFKLKESLSVEELIKLEKRDGSP